MKENKIVPFRSKFSDIKSEFESRLEEIRSVTEAKILATDITNFLNKSSDLSDAKKLELKSLRQKVYDRKRKIPISKNTTSEVVQCTPIKEEPQMPVENIIKENFSIYEKATRSTPVQTRSIGDFLNIAQRIVIAILFISFAFTAMWFVFIQSIPLYQAIGFPNPRFCAAGAIFMIGAFALFHWFTKSKILLVLCLLVSTYEVVLVVQGTSTHEVMLSQEKIKNNGNLIWLKEDADQKKESYEILKVKYDDPNSKVYKNDWYKKKFIEPAWKSYSQAEEKINETENKLSKIYNPSSNITILKILFRLGLVFLVMIAIQQSLRALETLKEPIFGLFFNEERLLKYKSDNA